MLHKLENLIVDSNQKNADEVSTLIKELIALNFSVEDQQYLYKAVVELLYRLNKSNELLKIRQQLWSNNFGVPSLEFVLINQKIINESIEIISQQQPFLKVKELLQSGLKDYSLFVKNKENTNLYENHEKPSPDPSGTFIATVNKQGYILSKLQNAKFSTFENCH